MDKFSARPVTDELLAAWLLTADDAVGQMRLGGANWVMIVRSLIAEVKRLKSGGDTEGWLREDYANRWVKGTRMIWGPLGSGFFCAYDDGIWLPGLYDTFDTVVLAFRFDDGTLQVKQEEANARAGGIGGIITAEDLT